MKSINRYILGILNAKQIAATPRFVCDHGKAFRKKGILAAAFLFMLHLSPAHAQCTSPAGTGGEVLFGEDDNVPAYCDGTDWIAMIGASGEPFNSNNHNCTVNNGGPLVQAGIDSSNRADHVWASNGTVFVDGDSAGLFAYTFDGTSFTAAGSVDPGRTRGIWSDGTYIYATERDTGLIVYSHDGSSFTEIDRITATGRMSKVSGDNDYIYVVQDADSNGSGDTILAYSFDGTTLSLLDSYNPTSNDARDACSNDDGFVHIGGNGHLTAVSFDGSSFSFVDSETTPTLIESVWCDDTYIFAGSRASSPRTTAYTFNGTAYTVGGLISGETIGDIWYDGVYLYVPYEQGVDTGIRVYEYDGSSFTEVDSLITPNANGPNGVWGDGTYLYAGDIGDGIIAYSGFGCASTSPSSGTQIVPSGLVGYWRLDETTGTTAADSTGSNDGTMNGGLDAGTDSVAGQIATAMRFDGTDDYISVGQMDSLIGLTTISMSFWFNPDVLLTAANENGGLVLQQDDFDNQMGCRFDANTADLKCYVEVSNNVTIVEIPFSSFGIGKWHHIAYTFDSGTSNVYLNGSLTDTNTNGSVTTIPDFTTDMRIGETSSQSGSFGHYDGLIDGVRIYNRAITADEVLEIYNARDGIRYNDAQRTMEFFDGDQWVSMTLPWPEPGDAPVFSSGADASCANIGDLCTDGSLFAGDTNLFVTDENQSGASQWATAQGNDDINPDSTTDGQSNHTNVTVAFTNLPAMNLCETLDRHGHQDWYLPAEDELSVLYANRAAINTNASESFTSDNYWSSTELSVNTARHIAFSSGSLFSGNKDSTTRDVRCVRRGTQTVTGTGGLIAHWKLDETEGTTSFDSSGNSRDGTWTNSPQASTTGAVGRSLRFDQGNNNYVSVTNTGNVFTTAPFTISNWVKFDQLSTVVGGQIFMRMRHSASPFHAYEARMESTANNLLYIVRDSGGTGYNVTSDAPVAAEQWHHVVLTLDASYNATLYLNGVAQTDTETPGSLYAADGDLRIGGNNGINVNLGGNVDDVRFYDRILTTDEITQLYNMGTPVGSSTALPAGCPNIGDICDDGTVYAGLSPDGSVAMFTTPSDQGTYNWNSNSTNWVSVTGTDSDTGAANTNLLVTTDSDSVTSGFQTHEAAQACYDLVTNGVDDWYLPALNELTVLYSGKNAIGNFLDDRYWSSRQANISGAEYVDFTDGSNAGRNKNSNENVRCVRKGPAPRCANPYGMEGDVFYNTTHNVLQYCDGARWMAIGKVN